MVDKAKAFALVVAHTLLSLIAVFIAGLTFNFVRPVMGYDRYRMFARSPIALVLALIVVAMWGLILWVQWNDRRAFFAWLLPLLWLSNSLLRHGPTELFGAASWTDITTWPTALIVVTIGVSYSLGARLGAALNHK